MKIERKNTKSANMHIRLEESRKSLIGRKASELGLSASELVRLVLEREFPLLDQPFVQK